MAEVHLNQPRFLVPLSGKPEVKPVVGFDVETYGTKNKFVLGHISYPDGSNPVYTDPEEMLSALSDRKLLGSLIYATNLHFDAFTLFSEVAKDRRIPDGWSAFDNGSKLIWCRKLVREYERADGRMSREYQTLLDSLNLFPIGVYNLGAILGKVSSTYRRAGNTELAAYYDVRKLETPACMGKKKLESLTREEFDSLSTYCAADAEVTRKFMEWANSEIVSLGAVPKITAASTAMDLFRRVYLKRDNRVIPQPEWQCLVDSRFSYYGGRTEDFFKGNVGPAVEQDVTAMYPSAMVECEFPYPSPENLVKYTNPSDQCLEYEGFTHGVITVPDMRHPPLPFKTAGHLMFPIGQLEGTWTNIEWRHALAVGCQIERLDWSYYNVKTFNPFRGYVQDLIKLRLAYLCPGCPQSEASGQPCWKLGLKCVNAHATEEVIKLFLNGLYGKFAQNFLTEKEAAELEVAIKKGGGTFKPISEASKEEFAYTAARHPEYLAQGIVINAAVPKLKAFMNPILAAYVTAQARVKLHRYMLDAEKLGISVYYTDTDSLYTDRPLPFATKSKELGMLQLGKPADELIIIGPKAKLIRDSSGSKATFKGVPGKSWLVTDAESMTTKGNTPRQDLFDTMESDKLQVSFTRFAKVRESMQRGLSPNEMVQVTKEFKPFANPKRRIIGKPTVRKLLSERFDSIPWRINRDTQEIEA